MVIKVTHDVGHGASAESGMHGAEFEVVSDVPGWGVLLIYTMVFLAWVRSGIYCVYGVFGRLRRSY